MKIKISKILFFLLIFNCFSCKKVESAETIILNPEVKYYFNDTCFVHNFAFYNKQQSGEFIQIIFPLSMHNRNKIGQNRFFLYYNKEKYSLIVNNIRKINKKQVLYTFELLALKNKSLKQVFSNMQDDDNKIVLKQKFIKIIKHTTFYMLNNENHILKIPYTKKTNFFIYYTNIESDNKTIILK